MCVSGWLCWNPRGIRPHDRIRRGRRDRVETNNNPSLPQLTRFVEILAKFLIYPNQVNGSRNRGTDYGSNHKTSQLNNPQFNWRRQIPVASLCLGRSPPSI